MYIFPPIARVYMPCRRPPLFNLSRYILAAAATTSQREKQKMSNPEKDNIELLTFKGFDMNLQCRGFRYEIGGVYEHKGDVIACPTEEQARVGAGGFHACEHPLDVFRYYPPATSRYALVRQSGAISRHDADTKIASAHITIEAELSLPQMIERAVKWVFDRANWKDGPIATAPNEGALASGYQGAATASGTQGAATASGDQGAATASGYQGAATASGTQGAATASGTRGAATASGYQGAATASGWDGRARGKNGCALFLVYRSSWDGPIEKVWAGIVGQGDIKEDVFYKLDANGAPVEIRQDIP